MITVNNIFTHWIRKINIKRYGEDIAISPLHTVLDIYHYYDPMLKHLPEKSLVTFQSELLYSNKPVIIANHKDRRNNNANDVKSFII